MCSRAIFSIANGKVITKVSEATPKDVDLAVEAAQKAIDTTWGLNSNASARGALLYKLGGLMEAAKDELAALEALDNGEHFAPKLRGCGDRIVFGVQAKLLGGHAMPMSPVPLVRLNITLDGQTRSQAKLSRFVVVFC